ncbi:hypothetical protein R3X27_16370 [Tropicimonas sp. TH_r6]|uniref:hypothetical protein n=1 Tax=Tropicimonas sp. TH_r6 TaxID=3082085 RepID=UPI002955C694|nr:hypothetical protein [Tropicimonas sp. TH_r6]MDV7144261.1 hypothetical protein [Tropicimonas sp. TH_r6]
MLFRGAPAGLHSFDSTHDTSQSANTHRTRAEAGSSNIGAARWWDSFSPASVTDDG